MKSIIIVMSPFASHLLPTFKMAKEIKSIGYKVVYIGLQKYKNLIEENGFDFQKSAVVDENRKLLPLEKLIEKIIANYNPSLFLIEVPFWNWALFLIGKKQRFKMIQTWPCCDRASYQSPHSYDLILSQSFLLRIQNELQWIKKNLSKNARVTKDWLYKDIIYRAGLNPRRKYITKKNKLDHYRIKNTTEIILFPEELELPRKPKRNIKFIGPLIDVHRKEMDFSWENIDISSKKVIYCSLGTVSRSFKKRHVFYESLIEVFKDQDDMVLIISVNEDYERFTSSRQDKNVYIFKFLPQLEVLKKTDLFITHGGAGSMKESIFFGVPLLVYPWGINNDRYGIADRIVYHNLGIKGDILTDNTMKIKSKILSILNSDTIKESVINKKNDLHREQRNEKHYIQSILSD